MPGAVLLGQEGPEDLQLVPPTHLGPVLIQSMWEGPGWQGSHPPAFCQPISLVPENKNHWLRT